jgi:hypothetical protein
MKLPFAQIPPAAGPVIQIGSELTGQSTVWLRSKLVMIGWLQSFRSMNWWKSHFMRKLTAKLSPGAVF